MGSRAGVGALCSDGPVTRTATELDGDQRAVRDAVLAGGRHVVLGAAGTGLTTTALETFAAWCETRPPESALLLVPTRARAAVLRDRLTPRLRRTTGSVLVRTPASLAYAILRLRASHRGEPAPTLVSGPEQDTVLAELIAGHLDGAGVPVGWPARISAETLQLPAFRDELRDLLMRAAEAGVDGVDLERLGEEHERPEWCAAGRLLTEYGDVMALGELTPDRGARYDAATIVDQAVVALRDWDESTRPRWSLVLHDDYQDATLATARLLSALADDDAAVAVLGDPDRGVQAFRGGQPSLLSGAARPAGSAEGALGARTHVLRTSHRHGPALRAAVAALTSALPLLGDDGRREATGGGHDAVEPVRHLLLPTAAQEVAAVARELRVAHLRQGVPWSRMAVVVRTGSRVGEIRRGLRTAGIPLAAATPDRPLREEPAVRPLLVALRSVLAGHVDPESATTLLLSPLGGLDAVSLRALRRTLRGLAGATRSSDDLLAELLGAPEPDGAVAVGVAGAPEPLDDGAGPVAPGPIGAPAVAGAAASTSGTAMLDRLPARLRPAPTAVARVLAAGRAALLADARSAETVLWAMWDATPLARDWQALALGGGAAADRADADLDAVVALFAAAEQFTDRTTGADPHTFLDHLATQDFAADTLAARGEDAESVAVHTAAGAAGGEWDVVVVAGVQEDSWPDLRIRDTLLGAQQLSDIATQREVRLARGAADIAETVRTARREVYADELRSFVSACSRASRALVLTAVLDTDARPSAFYEALLPGAVDGSGAGSLPPVTPVTAALDLRGLVGQLRGALTGETTRAAAALAVLEHLRRHGVVHADPSWWADRLGPTSTAPGYDGDRLVPVSPSAVEKTVACPLHWVLTTSGGRRPSSQAQNVGNLVHEIAAELPHGTQEQLQAELARRWHEVGLDDGWVSRTERRRADEMIRRLAAYQASHPGPVDVEIAVDVEVAGARLRGRVDRIEHGQEGPRVVDLKTGASPPSVADTARHAQLGVYQLALAEGALGPEQPRGGSLVYLGLGAKGATTRHQPPLSDDADPGWARGLVEETVRTLTSASFEARHNAMCGYCPVRTSCPVQPEGGRVVER